MEIPHDHKPHPVTGLYNGKLGIWLFLASEVMLFGALFSTYVLLRVGADHWPNGADMLNVPLATFNTLVLIASSVTMVMSWAALKMDNEALFKKMLGATVGLACLFLVVKYFEYSAKFHHHEIWLKDGTSVTGHIESEDEETGEVVLKPDATQHVFSPIAAVSAEKPPETLTFEKKEIKRISNFGPKHSTFFAIYFTMTGLHGIHILGGILVNAYLLFPGFKLWKKNRISFENRIECAGLYWHFVDLVWIFLFPVLYLTPGAK